MAIRVLHRFSLPSDENDRLIADAQAARGMRGCLEAEAYRGVRNPEDVAVIQLWADEASHDAHAAAVAARVVPSLAVELAECDRAVTEAYAHEYSTPVDGVWTAASRGEGHRIVWPARGPVRIIIQSCFADPDTEAPGLVVNEQETRREPGCLEFAWMRGVEHRTHILLTELWSSQRIYDQHWALRRSTGSSGPARQRAERALGRNGAEFYRHQDFRLLYGRWLPRDAEAWSTTVEWPA